MTKKCETCSTKTELIIQYDELGFQTRVICVSCLKAEGEKAYFSSFQDAILEYEKGL